MHGKECSKETYNEHAPPLKFKKKATKKKAMKKQVAMKQASKKNDKQDGLKAKASTSKTR